MHGLETIVAMNNHAANRVTEPPYIAAHVDMEYQQSLEAAWQNYELGLITYEQYVEERAELRNTYF